MHINFIKRMTKTFFPTINKNHVDLSMKPKGEEDKICKNNKNSSDFKASICIFIQKNFRHIKIIL